MANMTTTATQRFTGWQRWAKLGLTAMLLIAIAYLVGAYITGPGRVRSEDGYVPSNVAQLKAASIVFTHADGDRATLPVRLADTSAVRNAGLGGVGERALDSIFLLYAHTQPRTNTTRYPMNDVRSTMDAAIINAQGEVIAVRQATPNTTLSVAESHQWMLLAKDGLLEDYGIVTGSTLDIENIKVR